MNSILHIIATPKAEESRTLKISRVFLDEFTKKFPEAKLDQINLFEEKLPAITFKITSGKAILSTGNDPGGEIKDAWDVIVPHINRFMSADFYLISSPMWNFCIPYVLKNYIDVIVQPKYLFKYTDKGVEGLVKNKKMVVINSRGGDYSAESPAKGFDIFEPYLKTVFGFTGLTDLTFISAQPMEAAGEEVRNKKIEEAKTAAIEYVKKM